MTDDRTLLQQFAHQGSETAFAEFVRHNVDLVYSAALRQVAGDAHRAQDVVQAVFTTLALKARSVAGHPAPTAWLFTTTRYIALRMMRSEARRLARETEAMTMNTACTTEESTIDWDSIRPILDEVICELSERDREAVLLRFFQARPLAEVGLALGLSADAAQKRVERALGKLHDALASRGIVSTTAVLATAFSRNAVAATPAGIASGVAGAALATASAGASSASLILTLMNAKLAMGIGAAVIVAGGLGLLWQQRGNSEPARGVRNAPGDNSPSRAQPDQTAPLAGDHAQASTQEPKPVYSLAEILGMQDQVRALGLFADRLTSLKPEEFAEELRQLRAARGPAGDMSESSPYISRSNPMNPPAELNRGDPFFSLLLTTWGKRDGRAAIEAVGALRAAGVGVTPAMHYEDLVVSGWVTSEPEAAWSWVMDSVRNLPTRAGPRGITINDATGYDRVASAVKALADAGQSATAARFISDSTDTYSATASQNLELAWEKQDPQQALNWLDSLPGGDTRRDWGLKGYGQSLTESNRSSAQTYSATLSDWDRSQFMIGALHAPLDRTVTGQWISAAAGDNATGNFDMALILFLDSARTDTKPVDVAAEEALISKVKAADARIAAPRGIIGNLTKNDPPQAMALQVQFAPPTATSLSVLSGLRLIVRDWASRDKEAARTYLNGKPPLPDGMAATLLDDLDKM